MMESKTQSITFQQDIQQYQEPQSSNVGSDEQGGKNSIFYFVEESQQSLYTLSEEQLSAQDDYLQNKKEGIQNCESKERHQTGQRMNSAARYFEERTWIKKTIAQTLCKKIKICPQVIRQELYTKNLEISLKKDTFKTCSYSVGSQIVRGIQKYLQVQCNLELQPLKRSLVLIAVRKILHHRQHFNQTTCKTLIAMIRYIFSLQKVQLQSRMVIALYKQILQVVLEEVNQKDQQVSFIKTKPAKPQISQKMINRSKCQTVQMSKQPKTKVRQKVAIPKQKQTRVKRSISEIWTQQHQALLIKSFKESQNFSDISRQFNDRFPIHKALWDHYDGLRSRFEKVMRTAFNRLKYILRYEIDSKKSKLPELILMNQRLVKMFVRKIQPVELRLKLIEVLQGRQDLKLLQWLIIHINAELRSFNTFYYATDSYDKRPR